MILLLLALEAKSGKKTGKSKQTKKTPTRAELKKMGAYNISTSAQKQKFLEEQYKAQQSSQAALSNKKKLSQKELAKEYAKQEKTQELLESYYNGVNTKAKKTASTKKPSATVRTQKATAKVAKKPTKKTTKKTTKKVNASTSN